MAMKKILKGFTLVELMILVAVIGLLLVIANPDHTGAYSHNRKATAKAFLLKVSAYQVSFFQRYKEYASSFSELGLLPNENLTAHYNFQLSKVNEPSGIDGYSIKATPINSDESQVLWLDHLGQTSLNWND